MSQELKEMPKAKGSPLFEVPAKHARTDMEGYSEDFELII